MSAIQKQPNYNVNLNLLMDIENFEKETNFPEYRGISAITMPYRDIKTKELYCIKAFNIPFSDKKYKSFTREVSLLSQTNNPAVLSLVGFSYRSNFPECKDKPLIITKYYPNSLANYIQSNPDISSSDKYIIILGIAEGMKYLHSIGVTHRDLKPHNILLDDKCHPIICDLGQSRYAAPEMDSSTIGTSYYKAPELTKPHYSMKIDVFSFAMVFYEIFTWEFLSKKQFKNSDSRALFAKIVEGERPDEEVFKHDVLRNFAINCWDSDPMARPSFNEIVEQIKSQDFRDAMDANTEEVRRYISTFNDSQGSKPKDPKTIKSKADQGDVYKMIEYADMLFTGEFIQKVDIEGAKKYYKMAADKNNSYAMQQIAYILLMKNDEKSTKEAEDYLKRAIKLGNYDALILFNEYKLNEKVTKKEMAEFLKICADSPQNNHEAMYEYANILYEGKDVPQDKEKALAYFRKAADLGNIPSISRAARMLQEGDGVAINKSHAFTYFQKGIQKYDADTMFFYAISLINDNYSNIGSSNYNIVKYLEKASNSGNVNSMLFYSIVLNRGYFNQPKNDKESKELLKMANCANSEEAAKLSFYFATLIQNGKMNFFDPKDAEVFLLNAAKGGNIDAMLAYDDLLSPDDKKAINFLKKAANLGSEEARKRYCEKSGPFHRLFYFSNKIKSKYNIDIAKHVITVITFACSEKNKDKLIHDLKKEKVDSLNATVSMIKSAANFVYVRKQDDSRILSKLSNVLIMKQISKTLKDSDFI